MKVLKLLKLLSIAKHKRELFFLLKPPQGRKPVGETLIITVSVQIKLNKLSDNESDQPEEADSVV